MKKIIVIILIFKLLPFKFFAKDKLQLALIPYTNQNNLTNNYKILPNALSLQCLECEEKQKNIDIPLEEYYKLDYMEYRAAVIEGKYKIAYKNIFNQNIEKIIDVNQNNYRINICVDCLTEYKVDLWNQFKEFDTIKIVHIFRAHNYFESTGLIIYKYKNNFIAELHSAIPSDTVFKNVLDEFFYYTIDKNVIRRVLLNEQEVKEFSRFEDELNVITNGGNWTCVDYYHYTRNNIEIVRHDSKNQWLEFNFIKKKIFKE